MVFTGDEELTVRIEGESGDLEASLASVRAGLELVEEGLEDLERDADEAGDEMTELGAKSAAAAGGLSAAGGAASFATVNVGALSNTVAGLSAQLAAAAAILPGLTSALGGFGLAAAGVGVGGALVTGLSAAAAGAEELKRDLQIVRENIVAISEVAGRQLGFGDLLSDAIRALDDVFAETLQRVASDLPAFADALREFGRVAATAIPRLAAAFVRLGREALPVLIDGLRFLQRRGPQIFNSLVNAARRLGPPLIDLAISTAQFLGELQDLSVFFLQDFIPAVSGGIDALTQFARRVDLLIQELNATLESETLEGQFRQLGRLYAVVFGESFVNSFIRLFNQQLVGKLNQRAQQLGDRLGLEVARIEGLDPINLIDLQSGRGGRSGVPTAGSGADFRRQTRTPLTGILEATNEIANNTEESAAQAGETAANTGRLARTMESSALMSRSRCDLAEALLEPLERVPPGATATGSGTRIARRPVGPALDPGAIEEAVRQGAERATLRMDGRRVNETLREAEDTYGRAGLRRG